MKAQYHPTSKLLNVGCGDHYHPDWCNLEIAGGAPGIIRHDIRRGLPFQENTFDAVYHSHVLEHLTALDGERFLYECYRVLRPGGILRIVVPDLEIIASLYLEKLRRVDERNGVTVADYRWMKLELLDQMVRDQSGGLMGQYMTDPNIINSGFVRKRLGSEFARLQVVQVHPAGGDRPSLRERLRESWKKVRFEAVRTLVRLLLGRSAEKAFQAGVFRDSGEVHRWMYDRFSLSQLCRRLGFVQFKICGPEVSSIGGFKSYQLDSVNGIVRKPDSLFVECVKPLPVVKAAA
jgi:predicted SAM-dependent methyltransferase